MTRLGCALSTLFIAGFTGVALGNTLHFNDNGQIEAKASLTNINRIFVKGDKIIQHIAPQNTFVFDQQRSRDGSLYFKPMYQGQTFTIFFATEHGHHFSVVVRPVVGAGKTLKLIANDVTQQDHPWAKNTPYLSELQKMMAGMIKGDDPHFVMQKVKDATYTQAQKNIDLKLMGVTQGVHMTGITYEVANTGNQDIALLHRSFWHKGVLAIAFDQSHLAKHGHSTMWMIVEGKGDD